jgi:pyruvate formate lyase activating enzyme
VEAVVFNIQRMSIHDGPGIRTTVFLKGCGLRCRWCHNPESWEREPEVLWSENLCLGCGICLKVCPQHVYRVENGKRTWERARCRACGTCTSRCPSRALEMVGRRMEVEDVLAVVEKDRIFYEESGGGMTVSGGEPLLHVDFVETLLRGARKAKIHTNMQTNLHAAWTALERVLPHLDFLQVDLKTADPDRHRRLTGVSNDRILDNLRRLARTGREFTVRIPLIPGLNDGPEEVGGMARVLKGLAHVPPVELLPYHALGESKFRRMEQAYELSGLKPPTEEQVRVVADLIRKNGIQVEHSSQETMR